MSIINYSELTRRYVKALLKLVNKTGKVIIIEKDLNKLLELFKDNASLMKIVHSPIIKRDQLIRMMEVICNRYEYDDLTRKFCILLAKNRRVFLLPSIAEKFNQLLLEQREELAIKVIVSNKLTSTYTDLLINTFEKVFMKKVRVQFVVDPKILGGLVVQHGSKVLDGSIINKLKRLETLGTQAIQMI